MAASANPSGNQEGSNAASSFGGGGGGGGGGTVRNPSNGNSAAAAENSGSAQAMKHNPVLALEWSAEEQSILEDGLSK